jgi:UDP-N-acetylmuramoylalanine--D-glutamate ligase
MKKALILGLGISGTSAAKFLIHQGYAVTGVDRKQRSLEGGSFFLEDELSFEELFDLVVVSPGVSSSHPLIKEAKKRNIPVIGEVELALRYKKGRAVAITGTNGKTTVTALIEHILHSAGIKARAVGNIGTPLTEFFLEEREDTIAIIELSSYQIETLSTKAFEAALILNISPDHLDRYDNYRSYAKAKAHIQHCLLSDGELFLYDEVQKEFPDFFSATCVLFGKNEASVFQLKEKSIWKNKIFLFDFPEDLKGEHDRLNALAAYIFCEKFGVEKEVFLLALSSFKKPPHRIEFVCDIDGVSFFDDSKGTNVEAVIEAVHSMKGPVILLAGGRDKGFSYAPWEKALQGKVRAMFLFGEAADKMSKELSLFFNVKIVDSLEHAVTEAKSLSRRGDSVLLSPGCSSFDMFRDYTHRGKEFQRFVRKEERV